MKRVIFGLVALVGLALLASALLLAPAAGQAAATEVDEAAGPQIGCIGQLSNVKAITAPDFHDTHMNWNTNPSGTPVPVGQLDPKPLLITTVTVGGAGLSCLIAHFSAEARPTDNHVMFQVRVDGVPMQGHLSSVFGVTGPAVSDPEETDQNLHRMVAYNFFKQVKPGLHLVDVRFAACCSGSGKAFAQVGSPVLILQYR